MLAVNVTGTFLCTRAASSRMPRGGSIVNLASETAFTGSFGFVHTWRPRARWCRCRGPSPASSASQHPGQHGRPGLHAGDGRASVLGSAATYDERHAARPVPDLLGTIIFLLTGQRLRERSAILVNGGRIATTGQGLETVRRVRGTVAAMTARSAIGVERLDDRLVLAWDDGQRSTFHHLWLRDNCLCPACHHPSVPERLVDTTSIPDDITPADVELSADDELLIRWAGEDHRSTFPLPWLARHAYDDGPRPARRRAACCGQTVRRTRYPTWPTPR